jgi:hypothetical protein
MNGLFEFYKYVKEVHPRESMADILVDIRGRVIGEKP